MPIPATVRGLLIDLDGVCHVDGAAVPGAAAALQRVQDAGVPCRFVTNTTTRCRRELSARLQAMGLPIGEQAILSAPGAAVRHLRQHHLEPLRLVVAPALREDFAGMAEDERHPRAVVVGDIGDGWSHELLNGIFRQLLDGAVLIALHKGRFWETAGGLRLDIGAFIAGLEYATGVPAVVMGKPSPAFFVQALGDLGLPAEQVLMVGDDIDSDIGGAQACGIAGALVHTGKWRPDLAGRSAVRPQLELASLADLPAILGV